MRQRFQQMLVLLFSGLVALSSHVNAGQIKQSITDFYGLSVTNFGISLLKQSTGSKPVFIEKTTLNTSKLFGDPPNISYSDSPINFITLFLSESEAAMLRKENEDRKNKYGDRLQRQLYISAAGYDDAKNQKLQDEVKRKTGKTLEAHLRDTLNASHLDKHFRCKSSDQPEAVDTLAGLMPQTPCIKDFSVVKELEAFGCFDEPDKAEFNICATRWAFEFRTGIHFDRDMIVMEQDNIAMSTMANDVVRDKKLPPQRHFILHATTYAQPYLNTPDGLVSTDGWMGSFAKTGGFRQTGTEYSESLNNDIKASGTGSLQEFATNPETGLHHTVERYLHNALQQGDVFIAGNRIYDKAGLLKRITALYTGNNIGDLIFRIADTSKHAELSEATGLSEEHLQESLLEANTFLNRSRQYGAFSLALFLGLLEPALNKDSYIIVVGEQAEWFADSQGKSISQVLLDTANDEELFAKLHSEYYQMRTDALSSKAFDNFLSISGGERGRGSLESNMGKDYIKEWLIAMSAKVQNVHFVPKAHYNSALLMAFRTCYTVAQKGI